MEQLKNTKILWHLGYYDGPESGVLLYNDELHYFKCIDAYDPHLEDPDDEDSDYTWGWYRKHAVYALSDDDKIRLVTTHALWQAHMGLHTDYWPLNGRGLHPRKGGDRTVPCLHYGPSADRQTGWDEYQELKKHWCLRHGEFKLGDREPIGFIYHSQLYGNDEEVENDG